MPKEILIEFQVIREGDEVKSNGILGDSVDPRYLAIAAHDSLQILAQKGFATLPVTQSMTLLKRQIETWGFAGQHIARPPTNGKRPRRIDS